MVAYYPTVFAAIASLVISGKAVALASSNVHTNFVRQLPVGGPLEADDIPIACQTVCAPILSLTPATCADATCACSTTTSSALSGCLQCHIDDDSRDDANDTDNDADDATDLAAEILQVQQFYDGYANSCNSAGQTVPPYNFVVGGTGGAGTTGSVTTAAVGSSTTSGVSATATSSVSATATSGVSATATSPGAATSVSTRTQSTTSSSSTSSRAPAASGSNGAQANNGASRTHIGVAGVVGILGTTLLLLA